MQDFDQTIATPGKTIQFRKFELKPHLIVLYPQVQFKQIPLEIGSVVLGRGQDADWAATAFSSADYAAITNTVRSSSTASP